MLEDRYLDNMASIFGTKVVPLRATADKFVTLSCHMRNFVVPMRNFVVPYACHVRALSCPFPESRYFVVPLSYLCRTFDVPVRNFVVSYAGH